MYGLIGKIKTVRGGRDELGRILIEGSAGLPGCLSYIVADDLVDQDVIWVTEVWEDQASHERSLSLPAVQTAISRGRSLIASFDKRVETSPLGGLGLDTGEDS